MPPRFQSALHPREEISYLQLSGIVDEDNDLGALGERIAAMTPVPSTLVVDASAIERINSCGVRDWVNWLGRIERAGAKVVLVECSPSIVAQINLVNNFTGAGVVKSFYAPFFCQSCEREKLLLIETHDATPGKPFRAPTCRCDECDGPMDFDDMEDSYFAFLGNASKLAANTRLDEVVAEFTPSDVGVPKLRTRSGTSNPGLAPTGTPATPSGSFPSIRRGVSGNYPVVSPALAMGGSSTGPHARVSGAMPVIAGADSARSPSLPPPAGHGRGIWLLLGVLMASALALAAWLMLTPPGR